jgi:hypothetical protein
MCHDKVARLVAFDNGKAGGAVAIWGSATTARAELQRHKSDQLRREYY